MNKQSKMIFGVAAVGVAGYLIYKSMKPKTTASFVRPSSVAQKSVLPDLYNVTNACNYTYTQKAPLAYMAYVAGGVDNNPLAVGKRWFINFSRQLNYPNGIYSSSSTGKWAKIVNGVVTEVGTCGGNVVKFQNQDINTIII